MKNKYCSLPTNDGDLKGIYKYLCWVLINNGESSDTLHYVEVLYKKALKNDKK